MSLWHGIYERLLMFQMVLLLYYISSQEFIDLTWVFLLFDKKESEDLVALWEVQENEILETLQDSRAIWLWP